MPNNSLKSRIEDTVLNPLNNIVLWAEDTQYREMVKIEVNRIVKALEDEGLINKRIRSK